MHHHATVTPQTRTTAERRIATAQERAADAAKKNGFAVSQVLLDAVDAQAHLIGELKTRLAEVESMLSTIAESLPAGSPAAPRTLMGDGETLSIEDAARILGMDKSTAHRAIKAGTFPVPVHQIGGRQRVSRIQLERFLDGMTSS